MTSPENLNPGPTSEDAEFDFSDGLFEMEPVPIVLGPRRPTSAPEDHIPEALPYDGNTLDIEIHHDHIEEVLTVLLDAYENNKPPYNHDRVRKPQDERHMPEKLKLGGIEHANFLFNICYYMRGGIKSNEAVKRMSRVYDDRPDLFDCEIAALTNPQEIEDVLSRRGLGFQRTVAIQWVENARRLRDRYDGDPRQIFDEVTDYYDALKLICNDGKGGGFVGFQEKMTSMIAYYLTEEELVKPFAFAIPIDLHVFRVSIANELITFPNAPFGTNLFRPETKETLRKIYLNYVIEHNVDPRTLSNAVWMLSESSCGRNPGNTTIEPLGRKNRNGRSTYLIPGVVDINDPVQRAAYDSSCRQCPIERTCEYNIPGTHYYVGGNLIIRGRRLRFPESIQQVLFDI